MITISYKKLKCKVDMVKPNACECCGNVPKPRGFHPHHYRYDYTKDQVRKKRSLAKENVIWLCFSCHRCADALRIVINKIDKTTKIWDLIKLRESKI